MLAHVAEALDGQPHPVDRSLVLPRLRLGPEHLAAVRLPAMEVSRGVIPANVRLQTLLAINLGICFIFNVEGLTLHLVRLPWTMGAGRPGLSVARLVLSPPDPRVTKQLGADLTAIETHVHQVLGQHV